MNDLGHVTRRPLEIVNWTNEEGARFSPPMSASGCFVGAYKTDWVHGLMDNYGLRFGDELRRIGYLGHVPCVPREIDAYFELHIKQGPILNAETRDVGVVTGGYPRLRPSVTAAGHLACPVESCGNQLVRHETGQRTCEIYDIPVGTPAVLAAAVLEDAVNAAQIQR